MALDKRTSICRLCSSFCPIEVTVEDGVPVRVVGDKQSEEFGGYTCQKGRSLARTNNHPSRLLHSLKRQPDGSFEEIEVDQAIDEIADRLSVILRTHGPRAVASFYGNFALSLPTLGAVGLAFMSALQSPMRFGALSLDQPGDWIARSYHGTWMGGENQLETSDTWLLVGTNPIVSHQYFGNNPVQRITRAKRNGNRMIVIDPRTSETAHHAHVHLKPRPGHDAMILAGLLHLLFEQGLVDAAFLGENTVGSEVLESAVEPFTADLVCRRADIPRGDLERAAEVMGEARRGGVYCGTGASMSSMGGNLPYYLGLAIQTVRGWWARAGDPFLRANVLLPRIEAVAEPRNPFPQIRPGLAMRVRGLTAGLTGAPTGALCEEILLKGPGQVRALFNLGGNPLAAVPDAALTKQALQSLDLYVTTGVEMTDDARLANYVIASTTTLENPMSTQATEWLKYALRGKGLEQPYAHYAPATVAPPSGSKVIDDWQLYYRLAQRMGLQLKIVNACGIPGNFDLPPSFHALDMLNEPTTDDILEILSADSAIPLSEVKRHIHGRLYEEARETVLPRRAACDQHLDIGAEPMMAGLRTLAMDRDGQQPDFVLVPRRDKRFVNASGQYLQPAESWLGNPAFMHPADMEDLGIVVGQEVEIRSATGVARAIVKDEEGLRRGVVSLSHGFGTRGDGRDPHLYGTSTNRLLSNSAEFDPTTGMPRMGAVPITIHPIPDFAEGLSDEGTRSTPK